VPQIFKKKTETGASERGNSSSGKKKIVKNQRPRSHEVLLKKKGIEVPLGGSINKQKGTIRQEK